MMVSWLVYALMVSSLVGAAAWLAERGLRARGWPTRAVWAVALPSSVLVPLVAWLRPAPEPGALAAPGAYVLEAIPVVAGQASPTGPSVETLTLWGWVILTTFLLATIAALAVRLSIKRRRWSRRVVDGVDVLVSRRTGPAAMGLVRGRVVVPEWALELDREARRLLLLHESEHVRARDPQLALAGLLVCVLAPWNLPLWWQLRRLRLAIEVDCDARVLGRVGDARGYGSLLLTVGQHRAHLALALAEPKSMLERRIRMITRKRNGKGWLQAIGLAVLAGVALAVACETPSPTDSPESEQEGTVAPAERSAEASGEATGDLELPIVDNGRIRLSTGTSCAKYLIDGRASTAEEVGALDVATIHRVEVVKGEAAGEDAPCGTIRVVTEDGAEGGSVRQYEAQAQPAAAGERAGAATERAGAATERAGALPAETQGVIQEREAVRSEASDVASKPTFTPMTQAPKLTNGPEVQQLLADYYPPLLRDAGIGGTANVWFFIDETGHVVKAQIKEPSGHDALDQAALAVARQMEFEPAMNRDKRVPAWVALDITFEVQ